VCRSAGSESVAVSQSVRKCNRSRSHSKCNRSQSDVSAVSELFVYVITMASIVETAGNRLCGSLCAEIVKCVEWR
jgi:hypothetical protein